MITENKIITKEQAVQLYNLGFKIESELYWEDGKIKRLPRFQSGHIAQIPIGRTWVMGKTCFPAYDAIELGEVLPDEFVIEGDYDVNIFYRKGTITQGKHMLYIEDEEQHFYKDFFAETEAQVRGDCVIWILENEHLKL